VRRVAFLLIDLINNVTKLVDELGNRMLPEPQVCSEGIASPSGAFLRNAEFGLKVSSPCIGECPL